MVAVRDFPCSHHTSRSLGNTEKKIQTGLEHQRTVPVKKSSNIANKGIWEAFPLVCSQCLSCAVVAALEQPFMSMARGESGSSSAA